MCQVWGRGYCPRCQDGVPMETLEQAGRLSDDTIFGHIVILPTGDARVFCGQTGGGPRPGGERMA